MYYEEIQIGDCVKLPEVKVEREKMLDFAAHYNAAWCHVSDKFAASTRAGQVTSPGIYTFALMWGEYAPRNFGQTQDIGGSDLNMKFYKPVFAGDTLHGVAYVDDKFDRNPYNGGIWVTMEVYNHHDELVLKSRSTSVILKKNTPPSNR